ncbi:MAG: hypothetical protein WBO70_06370 [Erysipelotrichaceae bacterium]
MENLKIDLGCIAHNNKAKQEVVWMLNNLGFTTGFKSIDFYCYLYACVGKQAPYDMTIQFGNSAKTFNNNKGREISIGELRSLVRGKE